MYGQKNAKKRRIFSRCCDLFFGGLSCDVYEPELKLQVTALGVCTGHSVVGFVFWLSFSALGDFW